MKQQITQVKNAKNQEQNFSELYYFRFKKNNKVEHMDPFSWNIKTNSLMFKFLDNNDITNEYD